MQRSARSATALLGCGDISVLGDIDRLYDAVQQKHSQTDVVMANAGGGDFAPLGSITERTV
jgi:NAD(P)-dependent dehydrogenase (short-subunit alcohol dehydrogenase family)